MSVVLKKLIKTVVEIKKTKRLRYPTTGCNNANTPMMIIDVDDGNDSM